jgi:hypothetical protein
MGSSIYNDIDSALPAIHNPWDIMDGRLIHDSASYIISLGIIDNALTRDL